MTYGVYALGALMVVVGLLFIGHGVSIVRMELGWTQIMGGSVAASAGCIVFVLGLVLQHLEAMRDTVERLVLPLPTVPLQASMPAPALAYESGAAVAELRPLHPLAPAAKRDWPSLEEEVRPEPALTAALHPVEPIADEFAAPEPIEPPQPEPVLVQSAPALVFAEKEDAAHGPAVVPPDPVADPLADAPATAPRTNYLASFLARRATGSSVPASASEPLPVSLPRSFDGAGGVPIVHPLTPSRRTSIDLSSGWDEDLPEQERSSQPESPERVDVYPDVLQPAVEPAAQAAQDSEAIDASPFDEEGHPPLGHSTDAVVDPHQPVVVGRYNAGAASYVMYSNGTIEVETEEGTHQFASMQELKTFIERRDAKVF